MKLNYTFKQLDHSDALVEYTQECMADVTQFLLKEGYGNAYFSKTKNEFCIELSVNTKEKYFKATGFGSNPYAAVDAAAEKLEKQIMKLSKQFKNHKKPELTKESRADYVQRFKKAA